MDDINIVCWKCVRCNELVYYTDDGKRCNCDESPSPWKPISRVRYVIERIKHKHKWKPTGEVFYTAPLLREYKCFCGETTCIEDEWK
jgi:hypothetical protein